MSPTVFLLCMEYLSRLLKMKARSDNFSFHAKCEGKGITHLAFADDLSFSAGVISPLCVCLQTLSRTSHVLPA